MNIPITITQDQQDILDAQSFDIMAWAKALTENKIADMNMYPELRLTDEALVALGRTKTDSISALEVGISGSNIVLTTTQKDFLEQDMVDATEWMQNAVNAQVERLAG